MSDMKQSCPEFDLLAGWLEGSLSPAERAGVTSHLAACDDCRRAVAIASAVPPASGGGAVDEVLLGRIAAQMSRPPKTRVWAAAAAGLIAAVGVFWATRGPSPEPEVTTAAPTPPPAAPAPEPRVIPLPDPRPDPAPGPKPEDPKPATVPPAKPKVPGLPEEPRETIVKEEPEKKEDPAPVVIKPAPGPTTTDLARVYPPVFALDPTADLWLKRGESAVAKAGTLERVAWQDTFSAPTQGAGFAIEGKASVALDKGSEAAVSRYLEAYAIHLVRGAAVVDTEGAAQRWHVSCGKARLDIPALNGRLALEPRADGAFAAVLLEGRGEFKVGADLVKPALGRELVASPDGRLADRPGDPKRFTRLAELRPKYFTAFAATFDEKDSKQGPFPYTLLSGRRLEEGAVAYLNADGGTEYPKPDEKVVVSAALRPDQPIVYHAGMMLCFRYRTDLQGGFTIKLGKFAAVHTSSSRAGWAEAKIPLESFQEEGVRMVPWDEVTDVQFLGSAGPGKKGGKLDIDGIQFLRRAR